VANRRLLTGSLHRGNEPALLITGTTDGVRVESVSDVDVTIVDDDFEEPLAAFDPRKLEPGRAELRPRDRTFTLALRSPR
jgi:hypothetical protein